MDVKTWYSKKGLDARGMWLFWAAEGGKKEAEATLIEKLADVKGEVWPHEIPVALREESRCIAWKVLSARSCSEAEAKRCLASLPQEATRNEYQRLLFYLREVSLRLCLPNGTHGLAPAPRGLSRLIEKDIHPISNLKGALEPPYSTPSLRNIVISSIRHLVAEGEEAMLPLIDNTVVAGNDSVAGVYTDTKGDGEEGEGEAPKKKRKKIVKKKKSVK
eukprot:TRINITY_DN5825_c0_g1_i1.p1 TRINITY_DN5825_c0_g1~~TRINITY_DN5825_c0_g1_i1.p1  ORF type:complete len:218 (+),score=55.99 TRINITY_DN5825_c0_g1_i1:108-761(+)